jgi:hypothetical protein
VLKANQEDENIVLSLGLDWCAAFCKKIQIQFQVLMRFSFYGKCEILFLRCLAYINVFRRVRICRLENL